MKALPVHMQDGCRFYNFHQNLQNVRSDIAHFQVPSSSIEPQSAQLPQKCLYSDIFSPERGFERITCAAAATPAVGNIKA